MFGLSLGEMVLLGVIALIAIDPKDLPQVARTIGKFLNEMKRATGDITKNFTDVNDTARSQINDARKNMNDVFSGVTAIYSPNQSLSEVSSDASAAEVQMAFGTSSTTPIPSVSTSPIELTPDPIVEEQLAFQLTNFDDIAGTGGSSSASGNGHGPA